MLFKISTSFLFCFLFCSCLVQSQKTNKPQLELNGSVNFALNEGYPLFGVGSHCKLLWDVGKKPDALTAAIGFDKLYENFDVDAYSYTFLTTAIGYRKNIQSFFVEPKVGLGVLHDDSDSEFCAIIGIEPGIQKQRFSFSIDYRFISADGLVYGDHFHTFAVRVGYRISRNR